jgi:formylmethanofuran dehydrogenase subunit E
MHYIKRELIIGKEITCAKCHELTIARQEQLKAGQKKAGTKVLTCLYCSNSAKKETLIKYDNVLEDLFKDVS